MSRGPAAPALPSHTPCSLSGGPPGTFHCSTGPHLRLRQPENGPFPGSPCILFHPREGRASLSARGTRGPGACPAQLGTGHTEHSGPSCGRLGVRAGPRGRAAPSGSSKPGQGPHPRAPTPPSRAVAGGVSGSQEAQPRPQGPPPARPLPGAPSRSQCWSHAQVGVLVHGVSNDSASGHPFPAHARTSFFSS